MTIAKDSGNHDDDEFDKLCDRVVAGQQLPAAADLIRGCPFLYDDILKDAEKFAEEMIGWLEAIDDDAPALVSALMELVTAPSARDFVTAAQEFEAVVGNAVRKFTSSEASADRCHFYAAVSGDAGAGHKVAAYAVSVAYSPNVSAGAARAQVKGATAWLLIATGKLRLPDRWSRKTAAELIASVDSGRGPGSRMVNRMMASREDVLATTVSAPVASEQQHKPEPGHMNPTRDNVGPVLGGRGKIVVITRIGNPATNQGMRVAGEFLGLVGVPLPLEPVPDLARVRRMLVSEFPHAERVVDIILDMMSGLAHVKLPPLALVGERGCGKTTFALRLVQALGLPHEIFNLNPAVGPISAR